MKEEPLLDYANNLIKMYIKWIYEVRLAKTSHFGREYEYITRLEYYTEMLMFWKDLCRELELEYDEDLKATFRVLNIIT